jgi:NAD(P)-dependent dehydrogenase (short-subunit alcohol dehydrogenase family)
MGTVYITGGATGIGAAAVRKFAVNGNDVAVFDINEEAVNQLAFQIAETADSGTVSFFQTDVSDRSAVRSSIAAAAERPGSPTALFVNAGIQKLAGIFEMEDDDIDRIIDVNLKGALYVVAEVAALMRDAGDGGTIVLMGSDQALVGKEGSIVYGATKGAVAQMAKSVAMALSPYQIRVNAVCPATVKTPMTEKVFQWLADKHFDGDANAAWEAEAKLLPIGRVAEPEEIAEVVYFLSQPASSFMTGALVPVDGGLTAQ